MHLTIQWSYSFPCPNILAMDALFYIRCNYCLDKQLECKACSHSKGSYYHCFVNGLECLFLPPTILWHGSHTTDVSPFQHNCFHCTQSHQQCRFDADSPSQCKCCIKFWLPCLFKLSFQGCCNDLKASFFANIVVNSAMPVPLDFPDGPNNPIALLKKKQ